VIPANEGPSKSQKPCTRQRGEGRRREKGEVVEEEERKEAQ